MPRASRSVVIRTFDHAFIAPCSNSGRCITPLRAGFFCSHCFAHSLFFLHSVQLSNSVPFDSSLLIFWQRAARESPRSNDRGLPFPISSILRYLHRAPRRARQILRQSARRDRCRYSAAHCRKLACGAIFFALCCRPCRQPSPAPQGACR